MCFVFIWEQTATCATYSMNWLVFYNRDEKCLLRGTNWVFKQSSVRFVFKGLILKRLTNNCLQTPLLSNNFNASSLRPPRKTKNTSTTLTLTLMLWLENFNRSERIKYCSDYNMLNRFWDLWSWTKCPTFASAPKHTWWDWQYSCLFLPVLSHPLHLWPSHRLGLLGFSKRMNGPAQGAGFQCAGLRSYCGRPLVLKAYVVLLFRLSFLWPWCVVELTTADKNIVLNNYM